MIAAVAIGTWAYFGIIERLNKIETNFTMMNSDVEMNTDSMLIEHLAGELEKLTSEIENGQAPFDQQQKLTLEFYERRINSLEAQIEKLKDMSLQMKNGNH